jgi:hypoxia up-regulated 1
MTFGAAFHAANQTKLFRVKSVGFEDGNNYAISMKIENDNEKDTPYFRNVTLFDKKERYEIVKSYNLAYDHNVKMTV